MRAFAKVPGDVRRVLERECKREDSTCQPRQRAQRHRQRRNTRLHGTEMALAPVGLSVNPNLHTTHFRMFRGGGGRWVCLLGTGAPLPSPVGGDGIPKTPCRGRERVSPSLLLTSPGEPLTPRIATPCSSYIVHIHSHSNPCCRPNVAGPAMEKATVVFVLGAPGVSYR